jgi:hypothetical protein
LIICHEGDGALKAIQTSGSELALTVGCADGGSRGGSGFASGGSRLATDSNLGDSRGAIDSNLTEGGSDLTDSDGSSFTEWKSLGNVPDGAQILLALFSSLIRSLSRSFSFSRS